MSGTIFNKTDSDSYLSERFIYRVNPVDYISLTREILSNRNLFSEIDKIKAGRHTGHSLNEKERSILSRCASLLNRYNNKVEGIEPEYYPAELFKDFEMYRYFFKEIGASLKFNPLSMSDAGRHVREDINFSGRLY